MTLTMPTGRALRRAHEIAIVAAVHAAVFGSVWLLAVLVYAVVFPAAVDRTWFAIDLALIGLALGAVHARRTVLGFTSLGTNRGAKLVAIAAVALLCVVAGHLCYADWNKVTLDERNYLLTLRAGRIIPDGLTPFNLRWLMPLLAGRWNLFPVADAAALKALNFGALVVTGFGLVLLLVRLRIPLALALAAPVFLACSYLGTYGARNRLVVDPANYALFVMLAHTLIHRRHAPLFALVLLVDALNAEKAVYWIPVFAVVQLVACPRPWTWRKLRAAAKLTVYVTAPTVVYFIVLARYVAASRLEANLCFENLYMMSFSNLGGTVTDNVRQNGFRLLWFPFGAFTIYALLGFVYCARWMRPLVLLLIPIFTQALIACDTQRMLAYAFIVYLPFGYVYLARALSDLPRWLARLMFGLVLVVAVMPQYLMYGLEWLRLTDPQTLRLYLSGLDVAVTGGLVVLHFMLFRPEPPP